MGDSSKAGEPSTAIIDDTTGQNITSTTLQQQYIVTPSAIEVPFVPSKHDEPISGILENAFREHQISHDDKFMLRLYAFIITWHRVMKRKRAYYGREEQLLWERIYQGLTKDPSELAPITEDLLPQGLEEASEERFWRILQAFTCDAHMHELLGLVIDILYSLITCARPKVLERHLEKEGEIIPQVLPTDSSQEQQGEEAKEPSTSSTPLQRPIMTVSLGVQQPSASTPTSLTSPTTVTGEINPYMPSTPDPTGEYGAMASLSQQQSQQHGQPSRSSSGFSSFFYSKKPTTSGKTPAHVPVPGTLQHCLQEFMRPSRQILHEMIIQYQHIMNSSQKSVDMLDVVVELIQRVTKLLSEENKPVDQKTAATRDFYHLMMGFAHDDKSKSHIDPLIAALAKIELDPAKKDDIIDLWKALYEACQKQRQEVAESLETPTLPTTSAGGETGGMSKSKQQQKEDLIDEETVQAGDDLLHSIAQLVLEHDEHVMEVLHHAGAVIMPYSGGFSHTLAYLAKQLALDIFWDARRGTPTLDKEQWCDFSSIFPLLCDVLGEFNIGHVEMSFEKYDIILDNIQVNFKSAFPKHSHHVHTTFAEPATASSEQIRAFDVVSYTFSGINVSVHGGYMYKKKTGFPIYMDYGQFHGDAGDIQLRIQVISSKEKPINVQESNCTIGKVNLHFNESRHRILNKMQKTSFEQKIKATLKNSISQIIQHMILQLEPALP